jgi:multidrug efflux system outer membrane protein
MLVSACVSLAPRYQRPIAPVPEAWPTGAAYPASQPSAETAADMPWQDFVKDGNLRKVVELAFANSRDLRKAVANIASAREQYRIQRAGLLPDISANANMSRSRSLNPYSGGGSRTLLFENDSATVGISAYELDLFGRQRSLSSAAFESYLSTAEAERATRISLIANAIIYYLTLAADRSNLHIARQTLESAQSSMELTRSRLAAGVASLVDVKQAETVYQQARADVASLTASIARDRNALELAAGSPIDDELLPDELPQDNSWLAEVPAGLSSAALLARPDVLQAEHNLKAANANIGAARAAFFPAITLTANDGRGSSSLSSLMRGPGIWSFSPSISVPLFAGGANVANLGYVKAQRDSYVAAYELAIQTAFREVADALAVRGTIADQVDAQAALVRAAADSYRLAEARYSKGVDTFLNALDSQRTLYGAQKTLVGDRLAAFENMVTLYRVLGGGLAKPD